VSPALSDLPLRKITTVIESLGFVHVRTKGSHAVYRHPDGRAVVIPQHSTIKRGTLGSTVVGDRGEDPVINRCRQVPGQDA
jgi:predicted RNA binding protein YcfA (HicA-like mRNA interferase family)